jgi:hypothetical protein
MARKRWIQCLETGKLVPAEEYQRINHSPAVHDDLKPFMSPIDGSVIGSNKDLREHNKRHKVIQHLEFGEGGVEAAAAKKRREDVFTGRHSTAESYRRKCEINEVINHLERK